MGRKKREGRRRLFSGRIPETPPPPALPGFVEKISEISLTKQKTHVKLTVVCMTNAGEAL
jgi:hypothetical protein